MNFKPFFVHEFSRHDNWKVYHQRYNGFTAYVEPVHGEPRTVSVKISMCSKHDAFCKREGRSQAMSKEPTYINARDLEDFLEVYRHDVYGYDYNFAEKRLNRSGAYTHLYRYML